jgi:predicted negative regulator of RcsB-dependent stress response
VQAFLVVWFPWFVYKGPRRFIAMRGVGAKISKIAPGKWVCYFFRLYKFTGKEGTVGTTKLTRKEILAEDPVHEAIVRTLEFFQSNGKTIAICLAIAALLAAGIYGGLQYLDKKEAQAQDALGKGMDFFHGQIAADATDDPYSKGASPTFRSDKDKYQAAAKEFASVLEIHNFGKVAVLAHYYLGLSQLQLAKKQEALQNLESVANSSKDRSLGYLAKRVLATEYFNSGNYKRAGEILDSMIKDPQCQLPKEDLTLQLSRVLVAQGKRDEAIKVLRDASSHEQAFSAFQQQLTTELDKLLKAPAAGANPQSTHP